MKILDLLKQLEGCHTDKEISVSIYHEGDSGEQDNYEIDHVACYPDGSTQIKMSSDATVALGRQRDLELEVKHLRELLTLESTDAMITRMYELFQDRRTSDEKVKVLELSLTKCQKDIKSLKKQLRMK